MLFCIMAVVTDENCTAYSTEYQSSMFGISDHSDKYYYQDIYQVTDHVKVGFDDIFTEPVALKKGDIGHALSSPIRKYSLCFLYMHKLQYITF